MQYVLSLLPALACPLGMGLLMWFMMRGNKNQAPGEADHVPVNTDNRSPHVMDEPPKRASLLSMLCMCLNWKVVAGLAVVALIVGIVAPRLLLGAIPLLILAACPLSMLFMMRGMRGNPPVSQPTQVSSPETAGMASGEHIAALRAQLDSTQAQLEILEREAAERESTWERPLPEDEEVSSIAQRQSRYRDVPKW